MKPAAKIPRLKMSSWRFPSRLGALALGLCAPLFAAPGTAANKAAAAREAMERATVFMRSLATEGGYVYKYKLDLSARAAERPASPTVIAIQPPGTPSVGLAFVRAYKATGQALYLDAARDAALALVRCQLASGGWHRIADFDPARPNEEGRRHVKGELTLVQTLQHTLETTFDDDTTQSAVRFLLEYRHAAGATGDPRDTQIERALNRALAVMLRTQYPNGAWPQRYAGETRNPVDYPVRPARIPNPIPRQFPGEDYTRFYTFNDHVQSDCIQTLLLAHKLTGRAEFLDAAHRGGDFLLLAQLPEPHPGWAQQYNFAMEPAWARLREPPAASSAETANVIMALLDLHLELGDAKYFVAAERAVAWLRRSVIASNVWSRYYELGTNRPIYGDRDGGYGYERDVPKPGEWVGHGGQSSFNIPQAFAYYERVKREGRDAARAARPEPDIVKLEREAEAAIASLDSDDRWIERDWFRKGDKPEPLISTRAYISNMNTLAAYVSRAEPKTPHQRR